MKAVTAKFNAVEAITQRENVRSTIIELLSARLKAYKIVVDGVSMTDFEFSEEFAKAIEQKQVAEQGVLTAKNLLEAEKYIQEKKVVEATAEATAIVTNAKAQADALRLKREQVTPMLLQLKAIEVWDGKLPMVVGKDAIPFINVDTK
jgi:prohibitin 2